MESSPSAGDLCRPPPLPPTMGPAHQQQCKFSPAWWRWRCGGRGTVGPGRAGGGPGGPQQRARRSSQRANMRIVSLCGAGLGWAGLGWAGLGWAGLGWGRTRAGDTAPAPEWLQTSGGEHRAETGDTVSPSDQCPPHTWHHRCSEQDNQ